MKTSKPTIDRDLFKHHFSEFKNFYEQKSEIPFSFNSIPEVDLKIKIYDKAREKLNFQNWQASDIGSGKIIASTIEAIKVNDYLVAWQSSDKIYKIHSSFDTLEQDRKEAIEQCLFNHYHENEDKTTFGKLIEYFGEHYPLISYLFFIKDHSKYLPVSVRSFDKSFKSLGASFSTYKKCSWENYTQFLDLISQLQVMLSEDLQSKVKWLEAHTFAWTLSYDMVEYELKEETDFSKPGNTEGTATVKTRQGQDQFREELINYWTSCAVTGCQEHILLIASHIKPWSEFNPTDRRRLDPYNGLLLSPNLDACFDSGFISFNDSGKIMLSQELNEKDMRVLGINKDMKLSRIDPKHFKYLAYHRKIIFKN